MYTTYIRKDNVTTTITMIRTVVFVIIIIVAKTHFQSSSINANLVHAVSDEDYDDDEGKALQWTLLPLVHFRSY